jgi:DNA-binding transcriptional ArsR family regulator
MHTCAEVQNRYGVAVQLGGHRDAGEAAGADVDLPTDAQVEAAVASFSMLADPTRLRILWLVSAGEQDVTTLATLVGASASSTSQHLAKLRLAGLVAATRQGRRVLYRAKDTHVRGLINEALFHADHHLTGVADHP